MKKLFITLGSLTTSLLTFSVIACKEVEQQNEIKSHKNIEEIANKKELRERLEQNFNDIMDKYNNDLYDKIKLNQAVSQNDFEFLKNQLEIFNRLMQSSFLNEEEKNLDFSDEVSYLLFANDMTNEELGEMSQDNPEAEYYLPRDIVVNQWVQEILSNKRTFVTRFQWAVIGNFVGEVIADILID
ncbi:hypothetical protein [Mycoplasma sp. VS410B]|uniref:hypothetical protein n=1 Tax=Mycoplasma sp. VS410B TaxID=3401688 RepID=UPI003AB02953